MLQKKGIIKEQTFFMMKSNPRCVRILDIIIIFTAFVVEICFP